MKNKSTILGILAFAEAMSGEHSMVGRRRAITSKPNPTKQIPFNEQEGIKKLISEYRLIKSGKSKKGHLKQNRIVQKIESFIELGYLKKEDLTTA